MKIYVDIDNTICKTDGMNYSEAIPISSNIKKINQKTAPKTSTLTGLNFKFVYPYNKI